MNQETSAQSTLQNNVGLTAQCFTFVYVVVVVLLINVKAFQWNTCS